MNLSERPVIVKEFPQNCDEGDRRQFLNDLVHAMTDVVRPAVVLDCSRACRIDRNALHLFLCCLEEAMKRNGDVRLAGLHPDAWPVLESAGISHLFRNYSTTAEAVASYSLPAFTRATALGDAAEDEPAANAE